MVKRVTKADLQSRLEQAKLSAEIATHKLQRHLSESFYNTSSDMINPWSQLYDGQSPIFPLYPSRYDSRRQSSGVFVSEAQMDLIRLYSRFLFDTNLTAKGVIRSLENYVVKTGFEYVCVGKGTADDKGGKVKKVQRLVDDFLNKNNWFSRELDLFRRSRRDGEFFVRLFPSDQGTTQCRTVEPEQIRAPETTPEWQFGIRCDPDDRETAEAYFVTYDGTLANGEEVSADEMTQMKVNVDLVMRRGLSDFFCAQESLQAVQKLLRASVMGESVRQAIAYVRQFAQANKQTVLNLQQENTDFYEPVQSYNGGHNRLQPVQHVEPGSVEDIPQGLEYLQGPVGAGANAQVVLLQAYQALSAYWQIPSWMLSGDTGNVNFASALTMESPFVRNCEKEQKLLAERFKEILLKVIHIAVEQGLLPEDTLEVVDINVIVPPVVVRNAKEMTERNKVLSDSGLMSKRTWADKEELDYDQELETAELDGDVSALVAKGTPVQAEKPVNPKAIRSTTPAAEYAQETGRPE